GQCSELCGKDHAFMPIVVRVVSDQEYDAWKKQQQIASHGGKSYASAGAPAR
ncbi:cytochrome c oxidase subunit II, partial [Rhodopseudomonas palustris]|nr:cytochrome c oxidase subunit II [Rhodopseudomonas palustris]